MRDRLGKDTILGYCTNVHAGADYAQTLRNLDDYAAAVKARVSPHQPMGVGLWLSASAARQVVAEGRTHELRAFLDDRGIEVFTLNGFPYGDFHSATVKHRVYRPNWAERARLDYTYDLIRILVDLLPEGGEGSISTLPLGWHDAFQARPSMDAAGEQLTALVHWLARVELETGKYIHVDLEPEPGCALDTSEDVVRFFEEYLLGTRDDRSVLAYLRVCHDVCHAAVMREDQQAAIDKLRRAGLSVGKVQLSSAIDAPFGALEASARDRAFDQLRQFNEPRYLHQTTIGYDDRPLTFFDDLPEALSDAERKDIVDGDWRVHFHVPLFLERFGELLTTQRAVHDCLRHVRRDDEPYHFEVETYAWRVLPPALQPRNLPDGIADELRWVTEHTPDR